MADIVVPIMTMPKVSLLASIADQGGSALAARFLAAVRGLECRASLFHSNARLDRLGRQFHILGHIA